MTQRLLHFHSSLSCIGEGNGNPLQCSCLENPRDREPGGLQSMGSLRVGHDSATSSLSLFTFMHWRRKWQPTPVFLPGEPQGQGSWWAAVYGVAQSRTRLKRLSSSSSSVASFSPPQEEKGSFFHLLLPVSPVLGSTFRGKSQFPEFAYARLRNSSPPHPGSVN